MIRQIVCLAGCTVVLLAIASSVPAQEAGPRPRAEGSGRGGPPGLGQAAPIETATIPKDEAEKDGYLDYLKKVLPLVRPGGLVAAHNISARSAGTNVVKEITSSRDLETILYMQGRGMSVSLKKR